MDWIKIKAEHISPEFTNAQVGALVRLQLFIARYGRMPTDKEITKEIGKKDYSNLVGVLSKLDVDLKLIQMKVEEDREKIKSKRNAGKLRVQKHRAKEECNALRDTNCNATDKIREDKSIKVPKDKGKEKVFLKNKELELCHTMIAIRNVVNRLNLQKYQIDFILEKIKYISKDDLTQDKYNVLMAVDDFIEVAKLKKETFTAW